MAVVNSLSILYKDSACMYEMLEIIKNPDITDSELICFSKKYEIGTSALDTYDIIHILVKVYVYKNQIDSGWELETKWNSICIRRTIVKKVETFLISHCLPYYINDDKYQDIALQDYAMTYVKSPFVILFVDW